MSVAALKLDTSPTEAVESAYLHCQYLANRHYENFPVASRLIPAKLRAPIAAIYAFARNADDLADEGEATSQTRLQQLDTYEQIFLKTLEGKIYENPVFIAVADSVQRFQLSPKLFQDLISAFRQDVKKIRYQDEAEVLDYCKRSANPVGRLLLQLKGVDDAELLCKSDAICSALQIINFMQDIKQDYAENNRIYFPLQDMQRFGVEEIDIAEARSTDAVRALFRHQLSLAQQMLESGADLGRRVGGRLGLEISIVTAAGMRVIKKLALLQDNIYQRPRLNTLDAVPIISKGLALFLFAHTASKESSGKPHLPQQT